MLRNSPTPLIMIPLFIASGWVVNIALSMVGAGNSKFVQYGHAVQEIIYYRRPNAKLTIIAKINIPNSNTNPS